MTAKHRDRDLCATNTNEWDVFIAYYGDEKKGTQRQAEILFDALNGALLNNGHKLKVYQHTRTNPGGRFGTTPDNVRRSRIFLLLADKNIPTESDNSLLEYDEQGHMKRLYEEVIAFRESRYFRTYFKEAVCSVIICDDMSYEKANDLATIFNGQPSLKWTEQIAQNFIPLLKQISRFLIEDDNIPSENTEDFSAIRSAPTMTSEGGIIIGEGAQDRLMRLPNGKRAPYERLAEIKELDQGCEDNHFLKFLPPLESPFVPDSEVYADCDRVLSVLENSESLVEEEEVFLRFIHDICEGKKESRMVARVCEIDSVNTYGQFCIRLQPIEYLWIMRMTLLDTPFNDGTCVTTLRKKYANPVEEGKSFSVANRLSCHSGCGVFIITSDGYLVYQNRFDAQNNRVSFFPGKLSYTVSGSYLFNGGSIFDFMNEKIDRELGPLLYELYLWEFGYEYDYLHYQFSFFAFCEETLEDFIKCTNPNSDQAKGFSFYDLHNELELALIMKPERWESSAWVVLTNALMSSRFKRLLKQKCGFDFNQSAIKRLIKGRLD